MRLPSNSARAPSQVYQHKHTRPRWHAFARHAFARASASPTRNPRRCVRVATPPRAPRACACALRSRATW
eukprot:486731-Pleurochrysis_carterae.AAC.1